MQLVAAIEDYTRGNKELPTLPGIAMKILETAQDEQTGLKELGDLVATDPPLSAKILKLVNSPFFGFPAKIGSVTHAINLLGAGTVKNLSLGFSLVGTFRNGGAHGFDYSLFWKKSLIAATASKIIAHRLLPAFEEDLFFLGLIHNLGELALVQCSPDRYAKVDNYTKNNGCQPYEAESRVFQFNHMEIGEYLVRSWGLPESFSLPIRYHHVPAKLNTKDKEIGSFTEILHLASLCADMFYLPEKSLLLEQFSTHIQKHRSYDSFDLHHLLEQVYEQTLHVFPIFEVTLGSEKKNLDLIKSLRKEEAQLSSAELAGAAGEGFVDSTPVGCQESHCTGNILVVDDEERNVELIDAMLTSDGYRISGALSGREALKIVETSSPDIILLDVMMPEMDGFEVCRQLKLDPRTRAIPILMVTALNKKEHRVRAMEAGADDFLNKPVDRTELLVRVRSLVRIKHYHDELLGSLQEIEAQNDRLRELEKAKERLTHMIIHDLNNPLTAIVGNLELALLDADLLSAEHRETLAGCAGYCRDLKAMVDELLLVNKMENGKLELHKERLELTQLIDDLLGQFAARAATRDIHLSFEVPAPIPAVAIDGRILKRVVANLLDNAIRHSPQGGSVCVEAGFQSREGMLVLSVHDNGNGLLPEHMEKIFDMYEQVELRDDGVKRGAGGLGLAFCKMAVEAHDGKISAESPGIDKGTSFRIFIPA